MSFQPGDRVYFQTAFTRTPLYGTVIDPPSNAVGDMDDEERVWVAYDEHRPKVCFPVKRGLHLVSPAGPDIIEQMFA